MNKNLVSKNEEGKLITTSKIVAGIFGKRHEHALRDIREMECSEEFQSSNFGLLVEMKELPQGGASKSACYEMTKDGFSFLVIGYRGAKAARFKENFIRVFNRMEDMLNSDEYIQYRFVQIVEKKMKQLEAELLDNQERMAGLTPKAGYAENVLSSPDTYTSADGQRVGAQARQTVAPGTQSQGHPLQTVGPVDAMLRIYRHKDIHVPR